MQQTTTAEIMAVGTEILRGEIVDTNSSFIAARLPLLGIEVRRLSALGDDIDRLAAAIEAALAGADLLITCGGLGPTEDDLTRDAIARVLGEEMSVDPALEKWLRSIFERGGRQMPAHNLRQAQLVPSAQPLPNPRGTAPGWWVEKGGKTVVALPGPPRELRPMWQEEVVPRLRRRFPARTILARTIKTFSIPEARVAELLKPYFDAGSRLTVGIYSRPDGNQVRLVARGDDAAELLEKTISELRELLRPYVWGEDEDTLEGVIGGWLGRRGLTLATMEEATGGLLASLLSRASSGWFCGGVVTTFEQTGVEAWVPAGVLGHHGAISPGAAVEMARAVRERFQADFGLAVTALAGPENSQGLPPGQCYIAVADAQGVRHWQQNYPPGRGDARNRAAVAALFRLRERLLELGLDRAP